MMKLVDYSSSSDSDDNDSENEISSQTPPVARPHHATLPPKPSKKQIIVDLPKPSRSQDNEPIRKRLRPEGEGKGGLFSMLPPPKRSKPTTNGNSAKEVVDVKPVEETDEASITVTPTTFMPRSTQAKKGKPVAKPAPKPSVSLFPLGPELAFKPSAPQSSNPSTYEPLIAQPLPPIIDPPPSEPEFIPDTTAPPPPATLSTADLDTFAAHILEGRHRKNRTIEIVDYNAGEIYAQNAADKASGVLQEQVAPVRAIGTGRHQLTQLLNNVQDQRESLEEAFAKGRRVKNESAAKYGW